MGDHYFSSSPSVVSRPSVVRLELADLHLDLVSDRGVFSANRVDPGTLALLKEAGAPPTAGDVLDLGCGYGPITCTLAMRSPGARIWAVDINERARRLARDNAAATGAGNVHVVAPEDVPSGVTFAAIYSNPPVRIGKGAMHEMLIRWLARLEEDGEAWLVVNRHLGADSLVPWLAAQGFPAVRAASKSGYRVLQVRRGPAGAGTPEPATDFGRIKGRPEE